MATTILPVVQGGTGSNTALGARTNLGAAASGANSDITSLSGLTTPLSVAQGGTSTINRTLLDVGGFISLDWASRFLRDEAGTISVRYDSDRGLYTSAGARVVQWTAGSLNLLDTAGVPSVRWGIRTLKDASNVDSVVWSARGLSDSTNTSYTVHWENLTLSDALGVVNLRWGTKVLEGAWSAGSLTLTTDLTVPNGGTGASSLTGVLIGNGAAAFTAVAAPAGTIVGTTDTQTLTNKRINPRIQSTASAATVTPNADSDDEVVITAQAANLTLANPSGTPVQGQAIIIRIKDNGTARTITYGSEYRAIGVTLPATTVISKTLYLGMIRNSEDTKWDVIGVSQEA